MDAEQKQNTEGEGTTLLTDEETKATETPQATEGSKEGEAGKTLLTSEPETVADFEIQLPEGFEPDEELVSVLKATAKDAESAQKLADAYFAAQKRAAEQTQQAYAKEREEWKTQVLSAQDSKETLFAATAAMRQFATPELRQFLGETGLGDHPQIVNLMARVGKALAENSMAGASPRQAQPANTEEALAQKMYGP